MYRLFLSQLLVALSVLLLIVCINDISAESIITVKGSIIDGITIIEFQNYEKNNSGIETIQVWLDNQSSFNSFKTESGWIGKKMADNTIIFTTYEPIKPVYSIKFTVTYDQLESTINWKTIEGDGEETTGSIMPYNHYNKYGDNLETINHKKSITKDSYFKVIPNDPKFGSTISIIGYNFGIDQVLDFYIDNNKIINFETDKDGHFIITVKIPTYKKSNSILLTIKDRYGFEKSQNIEVSGTINQVPLSINDITNLVNAGSTFKVGGTAQPNKTIAVSIRDSNNNVVTSTALKVNSTGDWYKEIIISQNAVLGKWTVEIDGGTSIINKQFIVKQLHMIKINSAQLKYEPGDTVTFSGKALPNKMLYALIEDPHGSEVFSKMLYVDESGNVSITFKTEPCFSEGTYFFIASQKNNQIIVPIGIGEVPKEQLVVKMDKINYNTNSNATIGLYGSSSSNITLLVIDQYNKTKFSDIVFLESDGHSTYILDLSGYDLGTYTLVATRGNSQTFENFSVGLQAGSGPIEIHTTKDKYAPGESILVLGSSNKNIRIKLSIIDSDGKEIKTKEIFTNKSGIFSDVSFRIPIDAHVGSWVIKAESGSNVTHKKIDVVKNTNVLMIQLDHDSNVYNVNNTIEINGFGAIESQSISIKILDHTRIIEKFTVFSTSQGEFSAIWIIPKDMESGKYVIETSSGKHIANTEFFIE